MLRPLVDVLVVRPTGWRGARWLWVFAAVANVGAAFLQWGELGWVGPLAGAAGFLLFAAAEFTQDLRRDFAIVLRSLVWMLLALSALAYLIG